MNTCQKLLSLSIWQNFINVGANVENIFFLRLHENVFFMETGSKLEFYCEVLHHENTDIYKFVSKE